MQLLSPQHSHAALGVYGGEPGAPMHLFSRRYYSLLSAHALQTGGDVQPAFMLAQLRASVLASSGLLQPLEELNKALSDTYLLDARARSFDRARLQQMPPRVADVFVQQYQGPPLTAGEICSQVLSKVGALGAGGVVQRYVAGRSGQAPTPAQDQGRGDAVPTVDPLLPVQEAIRQAQLHMGPLQAQLERAQHICASKQLHLNQHELKRDCARFKVNDIVDEKLEPRWKRFLTGSHLAELVYPLEQPVATTAPVVRAPPPPAQPAGEIEEQAEGPLSPRGARARARGARGGAVGVGVVRPPPVNDGGLAPANDSDSGASSDEGLPAPGAGVVDDARSLLAAAAASGEHPSVVFAAHMRRAWAKLEHDPLHRGEVMAFTLEMFEPDPQFHALRAAFPLLSHVSDEVLGSVRPRLEAAHTALVAAQRSLDRARVAYSQAQDEHELARRERFQAESLVTQQTREVSNLQCKLVELQLHGSRTTTRGAAQVVFEAYLHPEHPELLVTPGTLVALLYMELIRCRCGYAPGERSLRHDPVVQVPGAMSLSQYGQLFKEAVEQRGQEDSVQVQIQFYLKGLADPALRAAYHTSKLHSGEVHTTLQQVIARVEQLAFAELDQLGAAAGVGGPEDQQRFHAKKRLVAPPAAQGVSELGSGLASGLANLGVSQRGAVISPQLVSALWPAYKGSERTALESLCLIHATGRGRPHTLQDCEYARKLSAMPLPQAVQHFQEYQRQRLSRVHSSPAVGSASALFSNDDPSMAVEAELQRMSDAAVSGHVYGASVGVSAVHPSVVEHFVPEYPGGWSATSSNHLADPVAAASSVLLSRDEDLETCLAQQATLYHLTQGMYGMSAAAAVAALGRRDRNFVRAAAVRQAYEQAVLSAPVPSGPMPTVTGSAPCEHCGRAQGHGSSICFAKHPDCAPPFYKGPLPTDGPQAEKCFLVSVRAAKPHSRHQQALAQGLLPSASRRPVSPRPSASSLEPPMRLLQRPPGLSSAADARAAGRHVAFAEEDDPLSDVSVGMAAVEFGVHSLSQSCVSGVSPAACAAQPVGFPVIDYATYLQQQHPVPASPRVHQMLPAAHQHLQQAIDAPDPSQQLYALAQGMQAVVASQQQLAESVSSVRARLDSQERLLSLRWNVGMPSASSPAEPTAAAAVVARPVSVSASAPAAMQGTSAAKSSWPYHGQEDKHLAEQLLQRALGGKGTAYVMDRPRHAEPDLGLTLLAPDGTVLDGCASRFDTGCTVNIITLDAVLRYQLPFYLLPREMVVNLANNSTARLLGVTPELTAILRRGTTAQLTTKLMALVLDTSASASAPPYDVLYGKGWMAEHGISPQPQRERLAYRSDSGNHSTLLLVSRISAPVVVSQAQAVCVSAFVGEVSRCMGIPMAASFPVPSSASTSEEADSDSLLQGAQVHPGQAAQPAVLPSPAGSWSSCSVPELCSDSDDSGDENQPPRSSGLASAFTAAGTVPAALVPDTQQPVAAGPSKRERPFYPGEFNPLEHLLPTEEPGLCDADDLVEDPEYHWHYGTQLSPGQLAELKEVLQRNLGAFAFKAADLVGYSGGGADYPGVVIELESGVSRVYEEERRYSLQHMAVQDQKCQELLDLGWIEEVPTTNPFASNTTCPAKKDAQGNWTDSRFCVDFRNLNRHTRPDNYRPPLPEQLFNSLGQPRFLTTTDLRSGFHQLCMAPESVSMTAFWWRRRLFAYKRMPFGLRNATAEFQRVVDRELAAAGLSHCAKVFVDDLLIHSDSFAEHLKHVEAVLQCLERVGLRIHPAKTCFRCHQG